eukprot:2280868-Alexandrium_andersonii.AAC.1
MPPKPPARLPQLIARRREGLAQLRDHDPDALICGAAGVADQRVAQAARICVAPGRDEVAA